MVKKLLFSLAFTAVLFPLYPQTIFNPNYGLKSHPTLDIVSVVLTGSSATLNMVIENRILDGTFCADKNIFIILPNGRHLKIKDTEGIPRCPETYTFQKFGEKLFFSLSFPGLPEGTQWFDLIEDCDNACFSFNCVILDAGLNQKIDQAYTLTGSGKQEEAYREFEGILNDIDGKKCTYEGAVYWNLIQLSKKMGNADKATEWLSKLQKSRNPLKEKFIESLEN
jgi:hypothetical protein